MTIYRGIYVDTEADDSGNDLQIEKRIDIIDTASNPYNVVLVEEVGVTDTVFTFYFNTLPPTATGTVIEYTSDGGLNWFQDFGGTTSPRTITLPNNTYFFSFTIEIPGGYIYWTNENSVIPLEMTEEPVRDIVIDNDEDKFTPIRARQLSINVFTSNTINLNTFSIGNDNRYKVNWYIDDVLNFTGFLSMGDLSQEFLPDPCVLSLIAVDGLGYLSDIPLKDFDGNTPQNEQLILDLLLWALFQTGLQLNLRVIFNIREESASTLNDDSNGLGHFFRHEFLDVKTFEAEVGELENCYDVITKILGNEAYLFQHLGEWRIVRVDEMSHTLPILTAYCWDSSGQFVEKTTETNIKNIGVGQDYSFMNDDAIISNERLIRESRLIYKFVTPAEIPCNKDFDRGDLIDEISPAESHFELDCWELKSGAPPFGVNDNEVYILRKYDSNGIQTESYVEITYDTFVGGNASFLQNSGIPVTAKDKFGWGYDFKWTQNYTSGSGVINVNMCSVRLDAEDGTIYFLDEDGKWYLSDSTWSTNYKIFGQSWDRDAVDERIWRSFDNPVDYCDEVPKSGRVYIMIHWENTAALVGIYLDIQNFTFKYLPFINGSYKAYTGQQFTIAQAVETRNVREKEVFIANSPGRIYKGSLLVYNGTDYELAGLFYDAAIQPDGAGTLPSGLTSAQPYGLLQSFDVWNQFNRNMVKVDGTVDHSLPAPSMLNRWQMTDSSVSTDNRYFILLHYEYDSFLCEWQAVFMECSNSTVAKTYTGNSFKYLTNE